MRYLHRQQMKEGKIKREPTKKYIILIGKI